MAIPLRTPTTQTLISLLVERWIAIFGLPLNITSDQGSVFSSNLFKTFVQKHGINHKMTTAYHPQANGLVERFHRRLKESLTAADQSNWAATLPWSLLAIRNAKGPDIAYSPAQALFGANTRLPHSISTVAVALPVELYSEARVAEPLPPPAKGRWHGKHTFTDKDNLTGADFVLIKRHQKRPLQFAYAGPFPLVQSSHKTVTVAYQGKSHVVSRDRVKPVFPFQGQFFFQPMDENLLNISDPCGGKVW